VVPQFRTGYEPGLLNSFSVSKSQFEKSLSSSTDLTVASKMAAEQPFQLTAEKALQGAHNYEEWAVDVRIMLQAHGSWGLVDGTELPLPVDANALMRSIRSTLLYGAIARISLNCVPSARVHIETLEDPKEMWDTFKGMYSKDKSIELLEQWRVLFRMRTSQFVDVFAFGDALTGVLAKLRKAGHTASNESIFYYFLAMVDESTDPKWTTFLNSVIEKHRLKEEKPSIKDLIAKACKTIKPKASGTAAEASSSGQALAAPKWKGKGKAKGREGKTKCPHCHKRGHAEDRCWQKHPDQKPEKFKRKESRETSVQPDAKRNKVVVVRRALKATSPDPCWYMDSGAYAHICKDRALFQTYEPCSDTVSVADGVEHSCIGSGSIDFCLPDGSLLRVTSVRHVPTFDCNLLSLGALEGKGAEIVLKDGRCTVYLDGDVLCKGKRTGALYVLTATAIKPA